MSKTWVQIKEEDGGSNLICFQCPISGGLVDIESYFSLYGPFLETLDGRDMTSFIDFFFKRSPVNTMFWEFVDDDAQNDFIDFCAELNLMPAIKNIQFGDWGDDEPTKPTLTNNTKNTKPTKSVVEILNSLKEQLIKVTNDGNEKAINKINEKIKQLENKE